MHDEITWNIMIRAEAMKDRKAELDYFGGFSADLPHPYTTSTGNNGRCEICGGHFDRLIHCEPWQRPIFGPCKNCVSYPDADCDVCGNTRMSFERIGIEEIPERSTNPTKRPYVRRWQPDGVLAEEVQQQ